MYDIDKIPDGTYVTEKPVLWDDGPMLYEIQKIVVRGNELLVTNRSRSANNDRGTGTQFDDMCWYLKSRDVEPLYGIRLFFDQWHKESHKPVFSPVYQKHEYEALF